MARTWATGKYQYRCRVEYDMVNNGTHHSEIFGPYAAPGTALSTGNREANYKRKNPQWYANVVVRVDVADTIWTEITDVKAHNAEKKRKAEEAKALAEKEKIIAKEREFWAELNDGEPRGTFG